MTHTPGPWIIRDIPTHNAHIGPADDGGAPTIAYVQRVDGNARLIAAAPDLLAALEKYVAWSKAEENHKGTTFWERIEMLDELDAAATTAISKATGETS